MYKFFNDLWDRGSKGLDFHEKAFIEEQMRLENLEKVVEDL